MTRASLSALVCAALLPLAVTACSKDAATAKDAPVTAQNAPEMIQRAPMLGEGSAGEFTRRVNDFEALRKQLDGTIDKLSDKATPQQIDVHQRALGALIAKARSDAKQGDVFVPDMQTYIRGLVRSVIAGRDGARIKASLMDENPMGVKFAVNDRYPDTVPLSTMPPDILAALPKLPDDLEYRFVGNRLVIIDNPSHLIVDFVDNTFEV